jgi:hypothetical protein
MDYHETPEVVNKIKNMIYDDDPGNPSYPLLKEDYAINYIIDLSNLINKIRQTPTGKVVMRRIRMVPEMGYIYVYTPYNDQFVSRIKNIRGAVWVENAWRIPQSEKDVVLSIIQDIYHAGPHTQFLRARITMINWDRYYLAYPVFYKNKGLHNSISHCHGELGELGSEYELYLPPSYKNDDLTSDKWDIQWIE